MKVKVSVKRLADLLRTEQQVKESEKYIDTLVTRLDNAQKDIDGLTRENYSLRLNHVDPTHRTNELDAVAAMFNYFMTHRSDEMYENMYKPLADEFEKRGKIHAIKFLRGFFPGMSLKQYKMIIDKHFG